VSQSDFVTRGQALVSSGQYQEAVKVCRLGLLGRPTTVEGRVVLGQALLALKRYDEVLAEMRVALELDHGSSAAQVLKGEALLRKGDGHGAWNPGQAAQPAWLATSRSSAEAERLANRSPPAAPARVDGARGRGVRRRAGLELSVADGTRPIRGVRRVHPPTSWPPGAQALDPRAAAPPPATPSPAVLAVGDRPGTVRVGPGATPGAARRGRFGDIVSPPIAGFGAGRGHQRARQPRPGVPQPQPPGRRSRPGGGAKKMRASMFKEGSLTVGSTTRMIEVEDGRAEGTVPDGAPGPGPGRRCATRSRCVGAARSAAAAARAGRQRAADTGAGAAGAWRS
jgi:hypothetical protein